MLFVFDVDFVLSSYCIRMKAARTATTTTNYFELIRTKRNSQCLQFFFSFVFCAQIRFCQLFPLEFVSIFVVAALFSCFLFLSPLITLTLSMEIVFCHFILRRQRFFSNQKFIPSSNGLSHCIQKFVLKLIVFLSGLVFISQILNTHFLSLLLNESREAAKILEKEK